MYSLDLMCRAARAKDGRLNALVRRGSIARRIIMYGE
jgi:hypothetical protein